MSTVSWNTRLMSELRSWEGTPYVPGGWARGIGVECIRFVIAVMAKLHGRHVHVDISATALSILTDPDASYRVLEAVERAFPCRRLEPHEELEPGDVLVTTFFKRRCRWPTHAMIVDEDVRMAWHVGKQGVCKTAVTVAVPYVLIRLRSTER